MIDYIFNWWNSWSTGFEIINFIVAFVTLIFTCAVNRKVNSAVDKHKVSSDYQKLEGEISGIKSLLKETDNYSTAKQQADELTTMIPITYRDAINTKIKNLCTNIKEHKITDKSSTGSMLILLEELRAELERLAK